MPTTFNNGRVFLVDKEPINGSLFFVYYKDEHGTKVITNSFAFDKIGVEPKLKILEDLIANKKMTVLEYGIGSTSSILSDFAFEKTKDFYKPVIIEEDLPKEDIFKDFENVEFLKRYSVNSQTLKYAKKTIPKNDESWDKLCTSEFIVLDTETTGISNLDEVIQVACIKVKDYKIIDKYEEFILPEVPINPEALDKHGISYNFLLEHGKDAREVFDKVEEFVGNLPVVGHNVGFDKRKIEYHASKVGSYLKLNICFDTLQISRKYMEMETHKLDTIADLFKLRENLKSHNAATDALISLKYASLLRNIYKSVFNKSENLF